MKLSEILTKVFAGGVAIAGVLCMVIAMYGPFHQGMAWLILGVTLYIYGALLFFR